MKKLVKIGSDAGIFLTGISPHEDVVVSHRTLVDFYERIVHECATIAEEQSRVYTGEHREGDGCAAAANAIRAKMYE